jgi:hypothetical protein
MIRERLSDRRRSESFEFTHVGITYVASVERFEDGRVAEVFLSATKPGSLADSAARDAAIVASIALQHGADPEALRHSLGRGATGAAASPLGRALDLNLEE